ncbi:MAG TPA: response regulator transcription factor [Planctomycetota bacterium]|jgi:DNA-binding NarL/FixJ family response regulator
MAATRVVIVDDHDLLRESLSALLQKEDGIEVVGQANSGYSGVAVVKETRPAVVLMDVNMEGMDGIEATRQIIEALPRTGVIALTISGETSVLEAMLRAGASGFVTKSEAPPVLLRAISEVAAGRVFLCPKIADTAADSFVKVLRQYSPAQAAGLTTAECSVLSLTAHGKSIKEIAAELEISPRTVNAHRAHIREKLGVSSDAEMTRCAIKFGLVTA